MSCSPQVKDNPGALLTRQLLLVHSRVMLLAGSPKETKANKGARQGLLAKDLLHRGLCEPSRPTRYPLL